MIITCKKCGAKIAIKGNGRKQLNISVINVYDALSRGLTIRQASKLLGCSRGYIYKKLKEAGEVNNGQLSTL